MADKNDKSLDEKIKATLVKVYDVKSGKEVGNHIRSEVTVKEGAITVKDNCGQHYIYSIRDHKVETYK